MRFQGRFWVVSVCQMRLICNKLFEMYFMALCGNTAGNLQFIIVHIEQKLLKAVVHINKHLSHIFIKRTAISNQTERIETWRTAIHCSNLLYAIQKAFFLSKLHISISKHMVQIHTAQDSVQKHRCFDRVHGYSIKISFFPTSVEVHRVSALATKDFILISTMSVTSTKDNQRKGSWEINVCHL